MAKAKLHLDDRQVAKTLKLIIEGDPKSNQKAAQYQSKVRNMADQLVGMGRGNPNTPDSIASHLSKDLADAAAASVSIINTVLKTGVSGARTGANSVEGQEVYWEPLSKDWIAHKQKSSKDFFWRNRGSLSTGFSTFSKNYSARLKVETRAEIRILRAVYGKPFTYRITLRLPVHQRYLVLNQVLAESFIDGNDYSGRSLESSTSYAKTHSGDGYTDAVVGWLEGAGLTTRYRPFISKVMMSRGRKFQESIMARVHAADAKVNKRRGLKFTLKT